MKSGRRINLVLACSASVLALAGSATAQTKSVDIPAEDLRSALDAYIREFGAQLLYNAEDVQGLQSHAVHGQYPAPQALELMLQSTGAVVKRNASGGILVVKQPERHAQIDPAPVGPASGQMSIDTARAQDSTPAPETMIVSSSRITAAGFNAPTPTTVLSADDIAKQGQSNVFTAVAELPSLMGSTGTTVGNRSASSGTAGLSAFAIHGVGITRALTLIDGQRVVPANIGGTVDISQFPQLLIKRIDVVTGGASASWGSDAISGVVNFILDNKYSGFKANLLTGITTYGDDENVTLQTAMGTDFLGGKAHIVTSLEYSYEAGTATGTYGVGCVQAGGRCWFKAPAILPFSPNDPRVAAGLPQYVYATNTEDYQHAKWGIITRGPLQGIAFNADGSTYNFNYGAGQTPNHDATGTVTGCASPLCIGGDTTSDFAAGQSLATSVARGNVYSRVSYDITPDLDVWAAFLGSQVRTRDVAFVGAYRPDYYSVQCDNAYLPASITTACGTNNITSFMLGSTNATFPNPTVFYQRDLFRYTAGADGAFSFLGKDWTWNAYVEHANNDSSIHGQNMVLLPYLKLATDVVKGANGALVCRSAAAQAAGCQPVNLFGNVQPAPGAMAWMLGGTLDNGPYQLTHERQEMASWVINGSPIELWAGPVNIATGMEYREEAFSVVGDPDSNGGSAVQPLLSTSGSNWYAGNWHSGGGNYHVTEGFLEVVVPLLNSTDWGNANLDVAGRATGYSTSGYVNTWKAGATWDTPVDGLRFRVLQSRDVRAPNISELFAPPSGVSSTVQDILKPGPPTQVAILAQTRGNLALKPEKSINTELGTVFQPSWLPGFRMSADYWRLDIKGEIGSLNVTQEVQSCSTGNQAACDAIITVDGGSPFVSRISQIVVEPFNLATVVTDGFDYEASYQFDLENWDIPGSFVLRALATNITKFITDSGVPGTIPIESAGANTGVTPHWKVLATQGWSNDTWSVTISERWISSGVFNWAYVQCTAACPAPTTNNPTVNINRMAGALYLDLGGSYELNDHWETYFKIDNVANKDPVPSPPIPASANDVGANPQLYDTIGRMFHVGMRLHD